jgi:hypothetical protein
VVATNSLSAPGTQWVPEVSKRAIAAACHGHSMRRVCGGSIRLEAVPANGRTAMVRKESPVRVRQRALANCATARFPPFLCDSADPFLRFRARRGQAWSRRSCSGRLVLLTTRTACSHRSSQDASGALDLGTVLAVAVNGRVEATTRAYRDGGRTVFAALVPPSSLARRTQCDVGVRRARERRAATAGLNLAVATWQPRARRLTA